MITTLLVIVVAGVSWAAYLQIRRATVDASEAHLESAVRQIAALLDTSLRRTRREVEAIAGSTAGDSRAELEAACAATQSCIAIAVWDRSGRRTVSGGPDALAQAAGAAFLASRARTGELVGPFIVRRDTVAYAVAAPITSGSHDTTGYYVGVFGIGNSSPDAVTKLLGADARLFIGNLSADVWTNLAGSVPAPPRDAFLSSHSTFRARDGRDRTGASARVGTAPWIVVLDAPVDLALGTARAFLAEIVAIGLLFALAGGAGVWLIVHRAVSPLAELRRAAEYMAVGVNPPHVPDNRKDEIGGLARTFNAMASRIHAAGDELTARAQALEARNEALRESERRYRQLVDQLPDAIVVHRDRRVVFANPAAAAMFGVDDARSLVGRPLLDLVDDSDRDDVRSQLAAAYAGIGAQRVEVRLRRLDGTTLNTEIFRTNVLFDGKDAVQSLVRDITDRKLLEEQYRQAQKMEAVGRLAGGVAHDFNNLLTVIGTYAEFTLGAMAPDDARRADVEEIRRAAASAAALTRQMLAFSRKQVLAPRVLHLDDVVGGFTNMLQRILPENIQIITRSQDALWPIYADAGQLEQVLMNLVVNARDAMPDGGRLTIETSNSELAEEAGHRRAIPAGQYVMLSVSDTGVGMTDEVKAHIFEPFFTTKQATHGTGLGLATAYGIVKQSGGYIWVYSEPGRGSSFKLYFPRHASEDADVRPVTAEMPVPATASATILLVEDDPHVRNAVRRILERSPHRVHAAASGPAAVAMFDNAPGRFDLVITDMMMPGLNGAELVRALRERNPDIRAIIMSGYSEEATARDWQLPPNALFLEKPVAPTQLLSAIRDLLGARD